MKLCLLTLLIPSTILIPISEQKSYLEARGDVRRIEAVIHRTGCQDLYRFNASKVTEFETKNAIEFDRDGKTVAQFWFRYENESTPASTTKYAYDTAGRRTEIATNNSYGESNGEKWAYNELGKIVQYAKMTNGKVDFQEDFLYNAQNLLVNRKSQTWDDEHWFLMDQSRLPIVFSQHFCRNNQGEIDSVVYSRSEGKKEIERWTLNGNPDSTRSQPTITEYTRYDDQQGREIFSLWNIKHSKSVTHQFYNSYGDIALKVCYSKAEFFDNTSKWGIQPYKVTFQYTYDQKGNWTQCKITNTENDWVQTITRKIEYWE